MVNPLTKSLIKLTTNLTPISVGTKFFPTNSLETEYVELFNYTQFFLNWIKQKSLQILFWRT